MEEQKTKVVIVQSSKSQGISFILTFLLGPLGLFYATIWGGIIMLVVGGILILFTLGLGALIVYPICIIWGAIAVSQHNKKVRSI